MRILTSAILGLGLLAAACDAPSEPVHGTPNRVSDDGAPVAPAASTVASTFKVGGHVSGAGNGNTALGMGGPNLPAAATSVDIMAMAKDGTLETVASAPIVDGTFSADVPDGASPTEIFIIKAKDDVGAVVGSGIVNGFLQGAFFKAFLVDAVIDTQTSYKAEILDVIAKKGVPGVQNYLNVVDTYVNAQLTNSLTVLSVGAEDIVNITNTTSDAIIAGEDVIESTLKSVGIPIDLSALQKAQVAVVSGFDNAVTSFEGKIMTSAENLFQGLEAATAKAAKPLDQEIFNAVVNGSGAMGHSLKKSNAAPELAFSGTKSAFSMQTAFAARSINRLFTRSSTASNAVTAGVGQFTNDVDAATTVPDLLAAQTNFTNLLLSKNAPATSNSAPTGILSCLCAVVADVHAICTAIESAVAPCLAKLTGVYSSAAAGTTYDSKSVGDALAAFDATSTAPAKMTGSMSADDANAMMQAINMVKKQAAL